MIGYVPDPSVTPNAELVDVSAVGILYYWGWVSFLGAFRGISVRRIARHGAYPNFLRLTG